MSLKRILRLGGLGLDTGGTGSDTGMLGAGLEAQEGPGDGAHGSVFSIVNSPGSGSALVINVPDPLGLILDELE